MIGVGQIVARASVVDDGLAVRSSPLLQSPEIIAPMTVVLRLVFSGSSVKFLGTGVTIIQDQLIELVKRILYEVAPDLEAEPLDPKRSFNEQFEFDSMDFLKFVTGLHQATELALPGERTTHAW